MKEAARERQGERKREAERESNRQRRKKVRKIEAKRRGKSIKFHQGNTRLRCTRLRVGDRPASGHFIVR